MKIEDAALCFCASDKTFNECCGRERSEQLTLLAKFFDKAVAYRDSQGGTIGSLPLGLWHAAEKRSLRRFGCIYPGCGNRAINSHLIPENVLRANFGGHCNAYGSLDGEMTWRFIRMGVGRAGSLPVFCATHDSQMFREIDRLEIDFAARDALFLFALKAIAFSLRRTQYLLGIDAQVEIARPFLLHDKRQKHSSDGPHNTVIDVSALHGKYIGFLIVKDLWSHSIDAFRKQQWDFMSYLCRSLPCSKPLFFGGLLNPSHDLAGRRANNSETPIAMACNVFVKDEMTHVLLACLGPSSQAAYQELLQQLRTADDDIFVATVNNFLTVAAEKPLVPETRTFTSAELAKVDSLRRWAGECLRLTEQVFDLSNQGQSLTFIEL